MHSDGPRDNRIARNRVAAMAGERARLQRLRSMTSALEAAFMIPSGDRLVPVLGDGTERCNRDALLTWVSLAVGRLEAEPSEQQVPLLAEWLHRTLTAWDLERGRDW